MINLRTMKWGWPLLRFFYRERDLQPREIKLDLLGFRKSIVETYLLLFRNKEAPTTLYRGKRCSEKVPEHIRTNKQQHWIVKGNQKICAIRGCSGTFR